MLIKELLLITILKDLYYKILEIFLIDFPHLTVLKVVGLIFQDLELYKVVDVCDIDVVGVYIDSFAPLLLSLFNLLADIHHSNFC